MLDTTAEAASIQIAAFRRLSPEARVALAFDASDWMMRLAASRPVAAPQSSNVARAAESEATAHWAEIRSSS